VFKVKIIVMESALSEIHNRFGVQLHGIICKKVQHQDHCHDIMQDVYLKIMLHLPKIENATNIAGYLVRLTNNAVVDHYRKAKSFGDDPLVNDISSEVDLPNDPSLQLADCCLRPMIDTLPEIYRDALVQTELEGMKLKDYAEKTSISLSNAKVRVQRGKEKLKEIILQCCNYEFDSYGNIIDCQKNNPSACCKK
jgi:RNA polymerase sigma-70 factor (ECF subfamily)